MRCKVRASEPMQLNSRLVASRTQSGSQSGGSNPDFVVDGTANSLFAAQVSFRSLYGNVAKQELNLFEFTAGLMAQPRACAPQIMRCESVDARLGGGLLNHAPNYFLGYPIAPHGAGLVDTSKQLSDRDVCRSGPLVDGGLDPIRDGYGSNMATFTNQVHDCPMALTSLEVAERQLGEFVAAKSAGEQ